MTNPPIPFWGLKMAKKGFLKHFCCRQQKRTTDDSVECRFGRTLDWFPIFSTCIQTFTDILAFTTAIVKHSKSSETF